MNILHPSWVHYAATDTFPEISCYMYPVIQPGSLLETWLLEDVLTVELPDIPRQGCFPDRMPPSVYQIVPLPPPGFEVILSTPATP
jgi:hypothetical protein